MHGLNDVSGNVYQKLSVWISDGKYQIYNQVDREAFCLNISDKEPLLKAFAYDCNRMSIAVIETIDSITLSQKLPKSRAWMIIQFYYSAFYAAHAILRLFGIACTQLDKSETNKIEHVADLFNNANGVTITSGFYRCDYDNNNNLLYCKKLNTPQNGGSHEKMWIVFQETLRSISNDILTGSGSSITKQNVAAKLSELCDVLSSRNSNWLSNIRNMTTYRHEYSAWYPYSKYQKYYDNLYDCISHWNSDPMNIVIWPNQDKELLSFMEACSMIVAICNCLIEDMTSRCSTGKSFHIYGPLAIINQMNR
jgi:hypothetical protein